jgi:hypothetical protein
LLSWVRDWYLAPAGAIPLLEELPSAQAYRGSIATTWSSWGYDKCDRSRLASPSTARHPNARKAGPVRYCPRRPRLWSGSGSDREELTLRPGAGYAWNRPAATRITTRSASTTWTKASTAGSASSTRFVARPADCDHLQMPNPACSGNADARRLSLWSLQRTTRPGLLRSPLIRFGRLTPKVVGIGQPLAAGVSCQHGNRPAVLTGC